MREIEEDLRNEALRKISAYFEGYDPDEYRIKEFEIRHLEKKWKNNKASFVILFIS